MWIKKETMKESGLTRTMKTKLYPRYARTNTNRSLVKSDNGQQYGKILKFRSFRLFYSITS